jgi:tRNA1Val (adenine37-N6)-methyltransferase
MPNRFFAFKQFTILQDKCAMKVCTDAWLFGAILANYLQKQKLNSLADIGTGTGLLSLMVAQKNKCLIDAYEIDENAAFQAEHNFNRSPWHAQLRLIKANIKTLNINKSYDWIFCNPPFYENRLKRNNEHKNIAMHSQELLREDVLNICKK